MKKNKYVYEDDGHTIYSMENLDPKYIKQKDSGIYLNKKEKSALIKAAFLKFLPILLVCIVGFGLAMLFIALWLK